MNSGGMIPTYESCQTTSGIGEGFMEDKIIIKRSYSSHVVGKYRHKLGTYKVLGYYHTEL